MASWLLFTYKVPHQPSARRVYIWRKLKGLGAISLHDMVWVLPSLPQIREKLQWLTAEVCEMEGGEATLWEAQQVYTGQEDKLTGQFIEQVEEVYRNILIELESQNADYVSLSKQYQQAKRIDYFQSHLEAAVREALLRYRGIDTQ
jgi:hypothetical protein